MSRFRPLITSFAEPRVPNNGEHLFAVPGCAFSGKGLERPTSVDTVNERVSGGKDLPGAPVQERSFFDGGPKPSQGALQWAVRVSRCSIK